MMLEFLLVVLVLLLLAALVPVFALICLSLPLSDALNILFRKVGLAGPFRGSRTPGACATGTITGSFSPSPDGQSWAGKVFVKGEIWAAVCDGSLGSSLVDGERVEIVYGDNLTVTVLGRKGVPGRDDVR